MSEISLLAELKDKVRDLVEWAESFILECIRLLIWAGGMWGLSLFINYLKLKGMDQIFLDVFQVLFPIATFIYVGIEIYTDIYIKILRKKRKIRAEIKIGDYDEPDKIANRR